MSVSQTNTTDPSISMFCILQRVKRIRRMLEIPFLKKQDSDDKLPSKGTPVLLHTGHSGINEQTSFLMDQDCPTLGEDTNRGDFPVDTSDTSEDPDGDCYPPQRKSNFIEGHKDVFKDIKVPSTIVVDENPWCFQCSEAHWEHECPCNSGDHQQESPQINITAEEQPEAIKSTEEDFDQIEWPTKEEYLQLISSIKVQESETVRNDVQIHPSQQKIFVAKSHPPPSTQYTRVIQGTTNFRVKEYKKGDTVGMWDANKGRPTNITEDNHFGFGPSRVRKKSVNDSYYLSTLEARRRPLPISGRLLEPHPGGGT
jgi:hypothetical protein